MRVRVGEGSGMAAGGRAAGGWSRGGRGRAGVGGRRAGCCQNVASCWKPRQGREGRSGTRRETHAVSDSPQPGLSPAAGPRSLAPACTRQPAAHPRPYPGPAGPGYPCRRGCRGTGGLADPLVRGSGSGGNGVCGTHVTPTHEARPPMSCWRPL